jgi:hypothetical protein
MGSGRLYRSIESGDIAVTRMRKGRCGLLIELRMLSGGDLIEGYDDPLECLGERFGTGSGEAGQMSGVEHKGLQQGDGGGRYLDFSLVGVRDDAKVKLTVFTAIERDSDLTFSVLSATTYE